MHNESTVPAPTASLVLVPRPRPFELRGTQFEKPELFESYVAVSLDVNWAQRYLFGREKDFRKSHPKLERRLWLSSGSEEWPDYLQGELACFKQIQSSKYLGLTLKIQSIAGERHAGVEPEAYNRAMRFVSEPFMAAANAKGH